MAVTLQQNAGQRQWRPQVADLITSLLASVATIPTLLRGTTTYNPPSIASLAQTTTTVTVTGAAVGNLAVATFSLDLQGITISATVSSANTVTVVFWNGTAGPLDLASGTLSALVIV